MNDRDRLRAACDRAIAAMRQPSLVIETAPLLFASRPMPTTPEYVRPDFGMRRKAAPDAEKARPPGLPVVVSPWAWVGRRGA